MGKKKTIIAYHGMCGFGGKDGGVWKNYKSFFEQRRLGFLAPTLPFHGAPASRCSPHPELGTTGLQTYTNFLEKYLLETGIPIKDIISMGHSMGALLAPLVAQRQSFQDSSFAGLVMLNPAASADILQLEYKVVRSFRGILFKKHFWRTPHRLTLKQAQIGILRGLPLETQEAEFAEFRWESGRVAFEMGFPWMDRFDATVVEYDRITCPKLVIVGGKDPVTVAGKTIAQKHGADCKVFPELHHWPLSGPRWEEYAQSVLDWLEERNII